MKFLSGDMVCDMVQLSRSTIDRKEKRGEFPARCRVSTNRVRWVLEEVEKWMEDRMEAREIA